MSMTRSTANANKTAGGGPHIRLPDDADSANHNGLHPSGLETIGSVDALELALSEPTDELIQTLSQLDGDVMVLGAGGKMGPTLARMALRASEAAGVKRRVLGVSRFSDQREQLKLRSWGIEALRGDLLCAAFLRSLPAAKNILYLVGMKFGSEAALAETWAANAYLAGVIAEQFPASRIVALSTGNVYGLSAVDSSRGPVEADEPNPSGEYAMSALGRERVFEYFSRSRGTPMTLIRLNYAAELRYGVLVDLAQKIYRGESVELEMGYFNAIWQRDACEIILRSFACAQSPPLILNVTGSETLSCRKICERFGELFDRPVRFTGAEESTALLSDASEAIRRFGNPPTSIDAMMEMTAHWIRNGGEIWNKPTHFQVRDGKY